MCVVAIYILYIIISWVGFKCFEHWEGRWLNEMDELTMLHLT